MSGEECWKSTTEADGGLKPPHLHQQPTSPGLSDPQRPTFPAWASASGLLTLSPLTCCTQLGTLGQAYTLLQAAIEQG